MSHLTNKENAFGGAMRTSLENALGILRDMAIENFSVCLDSLGNQASDFLEAAFVENVGEVTPAQLHVHFHGILRGDPLLDESVFSKTVWVKLLVLCLEIEEQYPNGFVMTVETSSDSNAASAESNSAGSSTLSDSTV